MKTSELTGAALNWAVAKCIWPDDIGNTVPFHYDGSSYAPSQNWAHGGPVIEREGITVQTDPTDAIPEAWSAYFRDCLFNEDGTDYFRNGPTPLIAAMRCYVASKLGDEVEVPEELI